MSGEDSEMTRSMRAYLANPHSSTSQAADPPPERERGEADFNKAQRATAELAGQAARTSLNWETSTPRPTQRPQAQAHAELRERTAACACYCRGEIPRFHRSFSPLGDLDYYDGCHQRSKPG